MQSEDGYSQVEVAKIFGVKVNTIVTVRRAELLAFSVSGRLFLYDKPYIDGLHQLLELAGEKIGRAYTHLYALCHQYAASDQRGKRRILAQCRELIAQGIIMQMVEFEGHLKDYVRPDTIRSWQRRGQLAVVKIGQYRYVGRAYALGIKQRYSWETIEVAAARLRTTDKQLYSAYCRGEIEGGITPGGSIRLKPNFTWRPSDGWMPTAEAAAGMGVAVNTLKAALRSRIVAGQRKGRYWLVSPDEVARWKRYFSTINPGFEWLPDHLGARAAAYPLMPSSEVERALSVTPSVLSDWCKGNLLPFYPLCIGERRVQRGFVRPYIWGLQRFGGRSPTKAQVTEYAHICRAASEIL